MTHYLLSVRVDELATPYVPSVERPCGTCGAPCWVDLNLTHIEDEVTCAPCTTERVGRHPDEIIRDEGLQVDARGLPYFES